MCLSTQKKTFVKKQVNFDVCYLVEPREGAVVLGYLLAAVNKWCGRRFISLFYLFFLFFIQILKTAYRRYQITADEFYFLLLTILPFYQI